MANTIRNAQIQRIVAKLGKMSNDTLGEALDELGAMDIAEAERNLHMLSGSSITRVQKIINRIGVPLTYGETFKAIKFGQS